MFLISSAGVIVVDPLPNLGTRYVKAAEVTDKPVTHAIYSHEHTDHIGAACLFPKSAVYIAHTRTAEILSRRSDPRRPAPTIIFDSSSTLTVCDQTFLLDYKGINHESGDIFVYAPKQRVLMLVDLVLSRPDAIQEPRHSRRRSRYIQAHHDALNYDFDSYWWPCGPSGPRKDVEESLNFVNELKQTVTDQMNKLDFPAYLRANASPKHRWNRHNDYVLQIVDRCYAQLLPRWNQKLLGTETYLKDNCWAMLESIAVKVPELLDR